MFSRTLLSLALVALVASVGSNLLALTNATLRAANSDLSDLWRCA